VVSDQIGAPTSSGAIAEATRAIVERLLSDADPSLCGIYHLTAAGETSWYDFARAILERDPRRHEHRCRRVVPITTAEYPTAAERPRYSVLGNTKVRTVFNVSMQPWQEALGRVTQALARSQGESS
jgi:dTDP-4-dehydrorhamnose reductase